MHILFVSGVFNHHVAALLERLKPYNMDYSTLDAYIHVWTWPGLLGTSTGKDACSAKKAKSYWQKRIFAIPASGSLSLYPILGNWCQQVLCGKGSPTEVRRLGENFLTLVLVIDLVLASAKPLGEGAGMASPKKLKDAIEALLAEFTRKHKEPKRAAQNISNASQNYEGSVLREVTSRQLSVLTSPESRHFYREPCLIKAKLPCNKLLRVLQEHFGPQEYLVARQTKLNRWEKCMVGDVLWIQHEGQYQCGVLDLLFQTTDSNGMVVLAAALNMWSFVELGARYANWRCHGQVHLAVHGLQNCKKSMIYHQSGDMATVLLPYEFRDQLAYGKV
eukprot:6054268-Amphidinium_carterae.1